MAAAVWLVVVLVALSMTKGKPFWQLAGTKAKTWPLRAKAAASAISTDQRIMLWGVMNRVTKMRISDQVAEQLTPSFRQKALLQSASACPPSDSWPKNWVCRAPHCAKPFKNSPAAAC